MIDSIIYDGNSHKLGKMNIVVGPNGSGKTSLINRILNQISNNMGREYEGTWPGLAITQKSLSDGDIKLLITHSTNFVDKVLKNPYSQVEFNISDYEYSQKDIKSNTLKERDEILSQFTNYCLTQNRVNVNFRGQLINHEETISRDILEILFRNPSLLKKINLYLSIFDKKAYLADVTLPHLELYICEKSLEIPKYNYPFTFENLKSFRLFAKKNSMLIFRYAPDGIKAFLNILFESIKPTNKLLIIDEPELHLFPKAKIKLGEYLGELSGKNEKQLILSTHDEFLIEGILNKLDNIKIIKLGDTKYGSKQYIDGMIDYKPIQGIQTKSSYLSLVYSKSAIVVEGITDYHLYKEVINNAKITNEEVPILQAEGFDRFLGIAEMGNYLNSNLIFIADFDVIKKKAKLKELISKVTEDAGDLFGLIDSIDLGSINNLNSLGIRAVPDEATKDKIENLLQRLKKINIFIAPNGEVEYWNDSFSTKNVPQKRMNPDELIEDYKCNKENYYSLTSFMNKLLKQIH